LYFVIEGETQLSVDKALIEIRRVLKEAASEIDAGMPPVAQTRYTVV
jgi:hypothetical protein